MVTTHRIFLALLLSAGPLSAQELTKLAETLQASVVVLEVDEIAGSPSSSGTGFFISGDGLIATNHHVIEGAQTIRARSYDRRAYRVEAIVAVDEVNDLAILRAEPGEYRPLPLGDSSSVETGDRVVVLGNPLGLDFTLSEGIISAVRAAGELEDHGLQVAHLQISAPISFGSSGSPVMNTSGKVVGVVASGFVDAQNLNFAVPVDLLRDLERAADRNPQGSALPSPWSRRLRNLGISMAFFLLLFWVYKRASRRLVL